MFLDNQDKLRFVELQNELKQASVDVALFHGTREGLRVKDQVDNILLEQDRLTNPKYMCEECAGDGYNEGDRCRYCSGTGKVHVSHREKEDVINQEDLKILQQLVDNIGSTEAFEEVTKGDEAYDLIDKCMSNKPL